MGFLAAIGNIFVMMLFALNSVVSLVLLSRLLSTFDNTNRGTNAVSRFVRNAIGNNIYKRTIQRSTLLTIPFLFFGIIFGRAWIALPSVIVLVISCIMTVLNRKRREREKDARVVTKGALRVGGVVGGAAAGAAAATATATVSPIAAPAVGIATAVGVNEVAQVAASNMCDVNIVKHPEVEHPELDKEILSNVYTGFLTMCKPEEFLNKARKFGIDVNNKSISDIADEVLELASPAMLQELPDNMSKEDKAMTILGGSEQPCENPSHYS